MKNKGQEPAIPLTNPQGFIEYYGMSTRLLIAAHLLQGLIAQADYLPQCDVAARAALDYADALIAEEEKTRTP
jgi:hypothetical protein